MINIPKTIIIREAFRGWYNLRKIPNHSSKKLIPNWASVIFNALFIALNFLSFFFLLPLSGNKTCIYICIYIYKRLCCFCVKRILAQTSTSNIFILQNHPIRSAPGTLLATFFLLHKKKNTNRWNTPSTEATTPWPRYDWQPPLLSPSKLGGFWIAGGKTHLYSLKLYNISL